MGGRLLMFSYVLNLYEIYIKAGLGWRVGAVEVEKSLLGEAFG
jgi:hypothetical protein